MLGGLLFVEAPAFPKSWTFQAPGITELPNQFEYSRKYPENVTDGYSKINTIPYLALVPAI